MGRLPAVTEESVTMSYEGIELDLKFVMDSRKKILPFYEAQAYTWDPSIDEGSDEDGVMLVEKIPENSHAIQEEQIKQYINKFVWALWTPGGPWYKAFLNGTRVAKSKNVKPKKAPKRKIATPSPVAEVKNTTEEVKKVAPNCPAPSEFLQKERESFDRLDHQKKQHDQELEKLKQHYEEQRRQEQERQQQQQQLLNQLQQQQQQQEAERRQQQERQLLIQLQEQQRQQQEAEQQQLLIQQHEAERQQQEAERRQQQERQLLIQLQEQQRQQQEAEQQQQLLIQQHEAERQQEAERQEQEERQKQQLIVEQQHQHQVDLTTINMADFNSSLLTNAVSSSFAEGRDTILNNTLSSSLNNNFMGMGLMSDAQNTDTDNNAGICLNCAKLKDENLELLEKVRELEGKLHQQEMAGSSSSVLKKILNLCETHFNTNETNETTKNPLVPVRLIPGDGQLTLLPGELLKIHTASNSKGRVLYRMLIRHFHGEENIVRGVPVETQMEQKLIAYVRGYLKQRSLPFEINKGGQKRYLNIDGTDPTDLALFTKALKKAVANVKSATEKKSKKSLSTTCSTTSSTTCSTTSSRT